MKPELYSTSDVLLPDHHLQRISEYVWEISRSEKEGMRVPARIFATEKLLKQIMNDRSLDQLMNVAMLPGIFGAAIVMPDAHEGYGFPIGGVAATRWPDGVISPGGIGYDINCGVRLLFSDLDKSDIVNRGEALAKSLYEHIPSGVGRGGTFKLTIPELNEVLVFGAEWAHQHGYATPDDLSRIESGGRLLESDPSMVSNQAKIRGHDQLGTIGSGNHFVEVGYIDELFDESSSSVFGLRKNQAVVLIHTGSRGLGHQVATDYLKRMVSAMPNYHIKVPDRELACAPFNSVEGQEYFKAMAASANYAWCNRQLITWEIRETWKQFFGSQSGTLRLLYDVAHNIAKIEEHEFEGERVKLIVHRKGATRAFGPGEPDIPACFQATGQPIIIPGSMGTASYIMAGTRQGMQLTFGSTCHGAGRQMSRRAAQRSVNAAVLERELAEKNIYVRAGSRRGVCEEAPVAYKDIEEVIQVVHGVGIAKKVARIRPLAVIKG